MKNKVLAAMGRLLPKGGTVTAALSGGADSVALLHCLHDLQQELGITLRACHFNHRLRGEASDGDEAFCRELCQSLGVELTVGSGDVKGRMAETGESLEEAARSLRYEFFAACGAVATAHNADDNAETVLLNLIRGTGLKGLCGIPEQRGAFLRPMLEVTRKEVLAYLQEHDLPHREDATNAGDSCLRNRLRHRVLPLLQAENPAVLQSIRRMTEQLRQDEACLQRQADALRTVTDLQNAPQALRRRAIRSRLQAVKKLSHAHIEAVEAIVMGSDPSAGVSLPQGLTARRQYDALLVERDETPTFSPVTLPCPGTAEAAGWVFTCAEAGSPITIRPRRTGDTVRLPGGTKTVKKLLIDRKIPAVRREMIPVLEQDGKVLGVWGVTPVPGRITAHKKEESAT